MNKNIISLAVLLAATTGLVSISSTEVVASDAIKKFLIDDATPYIDVRARYENVDQGGITDEAHASTVRTKLGYKTGKLHDFSATVEIENVTYFEHDSFNNTINGKTSRPVVADPDSTELNHAFVTYQGISDTTLQVGRQPVNLDNQRFVGTVGWRQNDQSFDAAAIINKSLPDTTLLYGYVSNVNRIFSSDHPNGDLDTNTHLINASYAGLPYGTLTGYSYLIDLNDSAVYGLSSKTFGARFNGSTVVTDGGLKALYAAEYAQQTDHADNPSNYRANYWNLEGGLGYKGLTVKAGYEELGSDNNGTDSFQTPLATGHKFNGWADKFLNTPATGLQDAYASVFYKADNTGSSIIDGTTFGVVYHDFSAESNSTDYGSEVDAVIKRNFMEHYNAMLKYADYDADNFATDTKKIWFQLGAKF